MVLAQTSIAKGGRMSALGQKQTYAVHQTHVRFAPESGHSASEVETLLRILKSILAQPLLALSLLFP
jgi:hypothetical protein